MLDSNFLAPYRAARDNFPTLLARSTYLGKYQRPEDASWTDTIARVVLGNVALDPNVTKEEAEFLFDIFWHGKALPPGRGLWTGGVPGIPVDARYNCHYGTLRSIADWRWVANMLMCGGGVGVGLQRIDELFPVIAGNARLGILCSKSHANVGEVMPDEVPPHNAIPFPVEDTREGWCEALETALLAAFGSTSVTFNLSSIRPRGTPIKTFGGVACGPGPLAQLLRAVWAIVRGAQGRKLTSVECLDITNHIGVCIKSGNVRRSALIVLGNAHDYDFRNAKKDWQAVMAHRHSSNNSIVFETEEQIDGFDWNWLVEDNAEFGEPGILNLWKIRQTDQFAEGVNPCQPAWATVLTPDGVRTMADIDVGSTIWSGKQWTKVVRKLATGVKPVFAYRTTAGTFYGTENHRVVSGGQKIEAGEADAIDIATGPFAHGIVDAQDVLDGLVIGDGMVHVASNSKVLLCIGDKDESYFQSEVRFLIGEKNSANVHGWSVETTVEPSELPRTWQRDVPERFRSFDRMRGFLRGLYSANGSVVRSRVVLKATSFKLVESVMTMLSALGIPSYYTTNKPKEVSFENGVYECRESYDVSIGTKVGRLAFAKQIGFIQPYKNEKLHAILAKEESPFDSKSLGKRTFDIKDVEYLGDENVFDITVDASEHTYWTGGLLVSNCGEIPLHDREACCLSEVYPALFKDSDDPERIFEAVTRYTIRQRLEPMSDPRAERVRVKNLRIGVGLGGICDFDWDYDKLSDYYGTVAEAGTQYAVELGYLPPIAFTTVKPSGTISLLNGSSPGIHAPFAPFYIRRTRIGVDEAMAQALIEAGVPHEPCVYDSTGKTLVFSFPMKSDAARTVQNQSVRDQVERQVDVQEAWADNAVSSTISFGQDEKGELAGLLQKYAKRLKSISCLPKAHGYEQPPYEEISVDVFAEMTNRINFDHPLTAGGELDTLECEGGACPIK